MKYMRLLIAIISLILLFTTAYMVSAPVVPPEAVYTQSQVNEMFTVIDDARIQTEIHNADLQAQIDQLITKNQSLESRLSATDEKQLKLQSELDAIQSEEGAIALNDSVSTSSSATTSGNATSRNATLSAATPYVEVDIDAYTEEVIRLTNIERVNAGLDELYAVTQMMPAAALRAKEYAADTGMKHVRSNGSTGMALAASYSSVGGGAENLSWNRETPAVAVDSWMASETHKQNILNPDLVGIAVGCYQAPNGNLYWCQLFIF